MMNKTFHEHSFYKVICLNTIFHFLGKYLELKLQVTYSITHEESKNISTHTYTHKTMPNVHNHYFYFYILKIY